MDGKSKRMANNVEAENLNVEQGSYKHPRSTNLVSYERYGCWQSFDHKIFLVSIVWSALGRTFHGLVSLAEIRPQDRNSVLVSFDRFFLYEKKFSWAKVVTFVVFEIWTI